MGLLHILDSNHGFWSLPAAQIDPKAKEACALPPTQYGHSPFLFLGHQGRQEVDHGAYSSQFSHPGQGLKLKRTVNVLFGALIFSSCQSNIKSTTGLCILFIWIITSVRDPSQQPCEVGSTHSTTGRRGEPSPGKAAFCPGSHQAERGLEQPPVAQQHAGQESRVFSPVRNFPSTNPDFPFSSPSQKQGPPRRYKNLAGQSQVGRWVGPVSPKPHFWVKMCMNSS